MIAASIGRVFLKTYNEKTGQNLSAKEFFNNEFYNLFYNHPKYMQWITNSPFVQMKSGQKVELLNIKERTEKLEELHKKIKDGFKDASVAIGFPASELKEYATTSGQVTDIEYNITNEDVYYSWIGGGLGVGVAGGYSIYFNHPEILIKIYDGWKVYRKYLNDLTLSNMRGNQINTWNGQWLNYSHYRYFRDDFDFTQLTQKGIFDVNENLIEINTIKWSELFFNLSNYYSNQDVLGYVYSLGQTNQNYWFFPILL